MSWVLGLAASHNGAAALYRDDTLVCAIQEERLTREKRAILHLDRQSLAVAALLAEHALTPDDLDLVVAAPLWSPRLRANDLAHHPTLSTRPRLSLSHHLAHALSAYACSGLSDATALVVDGMGSLAHDLPAAERAAVLGPADDTHREVASIYACTPDATTPLEKHLGRSGFAPGAAPTRFGPFSSLGLAYQQVAQLTFGSWDAAGKVMGLAPYGRPRFPPDAFFRVGPDGRLDFRDGPDGIAALVGAPRRFPDDRALHEDLAASVQAALELGLMHLVERARRLGPSPRLVCAGGVFLNSVANEKILRSGLFDEVFFLPFAEDSGTAVGAAFHGVRHLLGPRAGTRLVADALGPLPTDHAEAIALATARGARLSDPSPAAIAKRLAAGEVIGLLAGRSELGPRALGQRSILFDPRRADGQHRLNALKGREPFRPFAPAVLAEHAAAWFDLGRPTESPFMLRVAAVHPERRPLIPAVTHVDGTARVQTVTTAPLAGIVRAFFAETGVPLVLNTSFNRAGEPIVERAVDAVETALAMGLDALVLDATLLDLTARPA